MTSSHRRCAFGVCCYCLNVTRLIFEHQQMQSNVTLNKRKVEWSVECQWQNAFIQLYLYYPVQVSSCTVLLSYCVLTIPVQNCGALSRTNAVPVAVHRYTVHTYKIRVTNRSAWYPFSAFFVITPWFDIWCWQKHTNASIWYMYLQWESFFRNQMKVERRMINQVMQSMGEHIVESGV